MERITKLNKLKLFLAATAAALGLFAVAPLASVFAAPSIEDATCQGAKLEFGPPDKNDCQFSEAGTGRVTTSANSLIRTIINIFSIVVGIVAVIMIIYGGFRYITSSGDSAKLTTARNTIVYALVGLIIVVFAQFVVKFLLSRITGNDSA